MAAKGQSSRQKRLLWPFILKILSKCDKIETVYKNSRMGLR